MKPKSLFERDRIYEFSVLWMNRFLAMEIFIFGNSHSSMDSYSKSFSVQNENNQRMPDTTFFTQKCFKF